MAEISLLDAFEESSKLSTQKAVDLINAKKGANGGIATLDANGKIPASQLPDGLDEVIEIIINRDVNGDITDVTRVSDGTTLNISDMKKDVIYINVAEDKYANNIYRWSGTQFVLCPTFPKTEDMTVEFEETESVEASTIRAENIESGTTLSTIFSKISKSIATLNNVGSMSGAVMSKVSSVEGDLWTHTQDANIHVKGIDSTPTENSENVLTSHTIYTMGLALSNRFTPLEYYRENPTELPFMEESEFISAINTALSEVE